MSEARAIRMNDFAGELETLREQELAACARVLRSGWWILGSEVTAFEGEWAAWLDVPEAVGCANGLDAIEIGLRALGIGAGDEVITTPMTAFATVLGVLRAGAVPVLADVEPETANLSVASVERCVGPRTRAILPVHLYGQIGAVEELAALAGSAGAHLIEDCAQAHGARLGGRSAGSFGSLAAWSFYPTKNLGAVGDAGALTTRLPEVATAARSLRNYGQSTRYHHPLLGLNSRLDELHAAMLRTRLPCLAQWVRRRREIARRYHEGLRHPDIRLLPLPADPDRHAHHLFVLCTARRDALQQHLKSRGVESLIHYPVPIHRQDSLRDIRRDPRGLPVAEAHAASCLSLPCHPGLSDRDVDTVIGAVNEFEG